MTLNPTTAANDAYDMLDGSLSSFYQDVDEAIVASEVVKGQYRLTVNPAYNSPNPGAIKNFTTIGLSQSGPMVVDLENSFITANAHMVINLNEIVYVGEENARYAAFFLGWKSSIEAINRYDVLVNSTPVYNQSFCGEESFLQYQVLNENVKHTSPYVYTSYTEAKKVKIGSAKKCEKRHFFLKKLRKNYGKFSLVSVDWDRSESFSNQAENQNIDSALVRTWVHCHFFLKLNSDYHSY